MKKKKKKFSVVRKIGSVTKKNVRKEFKENQKLPTQQGIGVG
jgi:hypothetical protein